MNSTIENFIGVFEDAFTKEYCDSVVSYFNESTSVGLGITRQQQEQTTSKLAKDDLQLYSHSGFNLKYSGEHISKFNDIFWNAIYPEYANKYAILKDYSTHSNYAFKVQKTEIGQGYHIWHTENISRDLNNRILAWTLYLNDVEEGGETEFLYYPKRIKPKTGTFVLWPAGLTHTHRGNPPLSNTKYIVTGWIEF